MGRNQSGLWVVVLYTGKRKGFDMLATLMVIALLLLLFGVIGGIAISKFLFFILLIAAVVFLFGVLSGRSA